MAGHWRQRKWLGPILLALAIVTDLQRLPTASALTERVVSDWRTGLALHGFDPVAYFTGEGPALGRAEIEHAHAGVVWRFRNEGNRAAFAERPDVYMPQFGGYDPAALARGVATAGHPQVWIVENRRLYLFYNAESRKTFAADPDRAIAAARAQWPDVARKLLP